MFSLRSTIFSLAAVVLCLGAPAAAAPLTWNISGMFNDGGTMSGSFVYNADTNIFTSIDVTTTAGSLLGGSNYTLPVPCCEGLPSANFLLFVTATGDLTGTPILADYLTGSMTDAGGVINLGTADSGFPFYSEEFCGDGTCTGPSDATKRDLISGTISAATVPEPASFASAGIGLGLLVLASWRRKRQEA